MDVYVTQNLHNQTYLHIVKNLILKEILRNVIKL